MAIIKSFEINSAAITIEIVAENALLLSWPQQISEAQHNEVITLQSILKQQLSALIIESVASYHCLMVYYQFQLTSTESLVEKITTLAANRKDLTNNAVNNLVDKQQLQSCIQIPVYYDTQQQWDLHTVADHCNISVEAVIKLHNSTVYRSYALGFTPGFCYLASLPKALMMARKSSPRTKVPKGAVAIAERQTAIYPSESPGGWHIIGQTPLPMYQYNNGEFTPTISVGQSVKFYSISKAEFLAQQQDAAL
jgi:KipI family sensor histidine kinase inhibitor